MNEHDDSLRILVVDDEVGIREGCRKVLTAEGYDVETAADGLAGLDLFKARGNFAAALIDLKMPRMDGITLIDQLHTYDEDAVLFVITAYATIDTAVEVTKKGAYGYIPKPFTPEELLLPVKHGLEKRALMREAKRLRTERERRLLEVAFERSKASTILKCMTDGVLVINRDGQLVLRNAAAARMIPECAALPLFSPVSALVCPALQTLITQTLDTESGPLIVSQELTLGACTYMVNVSPVLEPNGETSGVVAVLRDITALKKLETAKSVFVSMVAHEVKSPVAAAEGYLTLILQDKGRLEPAKVRHMLARARLRLQTLRLLVSELLNLTALETGRFTLRRALLDLGQLVAEAVEVCRESAQAKAITLSLEREWERAGELVLADKAALLMVIKNLIENAVKYTPEHGHVWVQVAQNGLYATVTVKDDGIGMRPDEQARIFEEFFRAKNAYTAKVPGTGLGLSLVKRLVELHQGMISVETAPGQGSVFTVRLPLEG